MYYFEVYWKPMFAQATRLFASKELFSFYLQQHMKFHDKTVLLRNNKVQQHKQVRDRVGSCT